MSPDIAPELSRLATRAPESLLPGVMIQTGLSDGFVLRESPVGTLMVVFSDRGIRSVDLYDGDAPGRYEERTERTLVEAPELPARLARHLDRAIDEGRPGPLPVDLRGLTEFQVAVLETAARIPKGEVRPYGWIAKEIGNAAAVRAVGSALASNPIPVIIPCHRVVRSDGTFGKYSLGADENKPRLLQAEGLDTDELSSLARRGVRFVGTDTTRIFCHPTCHHSRRVDEAHRIDFGSEEAARAAGFRPCKVCRPVAA